MKNNTLYYLSHSITEQYREIGEKMLVSVSILGMFSVAAVAGSVLIACKYRKYSYEQDNPDNGEGGYGGGGRGWNPEDDTPPILPNSPGGMDLDAEDISWTQAVEDFANSQELTPS